MSKGARRTLADEWVAAFEAARQVRRRVDKSIVAQFAEMARLWRLPNRITPDEYYALCLYDDKRFDRATKATFLGHRAKPYVYRVNSRSWQALADDKLTSLAQLTAYGFPIARTYATYAPGRIFPGALTLATLGDVGAFLRSAEAPYPLFSKPVAGALGRGGQALTGYDSRRDELSLGNGTTMSVASYLDEAKRVNAGGTLFQELVKPHPALRPISGDRLSTVRVLVFNGRDGASTIHRVVWRVPVGANMVDNFRHGRLGNMLASVSISDGTVRRVVSGMGLEMRDVERHPDTGQALIGVKLPDWARLIDVCLAASRVWNGLRVQGWDVALSDRGPLLMEVNFRADFDLLQFAEGAGVLDDAWRRFMNAHRPRQERADS